MCKDQEKDYSLLRPLDLEAAKSGAQLCSIYGSIPREFVAGPDANGRVCVAIEGNYNMQRYGDLRMAPLCWVEGKPVYKGDVLYYNKITYKQGSIAGKAISFENGDIYFEKGSNEFDGGFEEIHVLTWTPPKVKREGWMNCYETGFNHVYPTKEKADAAASNLRIALIHLKWEE